MNAEAALAFLRAHQPLPSTSTIPDELLAEFNMVRSFFEQNPNSECVELLLNVFGHGDGHGAYQRVEDAVLKHDRDVVIASLQKSLLNRAGSVRYWSAQIAANYQSPNLIPPLIRLLEEGNLDERFAAVVALERMQTTEVVAALEAALTSGVERPVQDLIREVLGR